MSRVTKKELSDILGVDVRTLTNWESKGMPVQVKAGKGKSSIYETKDVIKWQLDSQIESFLEGNEDAQKSVGVLKAKAQLKKIDASGEREILRLNKERGELLHKDEVDAAWAEIILSFRTAALSLPSRIAIDVAGQSDIPTLVKLIEKSVFDMLFTLSKQPDYNENTIELPEVEETETETETEEANAK